MRWLSDKIDNALAWIANLVQDVFFAFMYMLHDVFTFLLDAFLMAIISVIDLIPVPDFVNGGMQTYLQLIDPSVLYFLSACGFPQAIALLGTGFVFRMLRKLATLGQW